MKQLDFTLISTKIRINKKLKIIYLQIITNQSLYVYVNKNKLEKGMYKNRKY